MEELFNFHIVKENKCFFDDEISKFIETCLDPCELFWGGGYNDNQVSGNIVGKINPIILNDIINQFILFFGDAFSYFEIFEEWKEYINLDFLDKQNVVVRFIP